MAESNTLLGRAVTSDPPQAVEVPMDQARIVFFAQTPGIGTRNLNGCTVVVIVSSHAAIMAHIAPNSPAGQPGAGMAHVSAILQQASALYTQYKPYFPATSTSCVISASFSNGIVPLDDQRDLIVSKLAQQGLTVSATTYQVPISSVSGPARGMAFLNNSSGRSTLYLADQPEMQW